MNWNAEDMMDRAPTNEDSSRWWRRVARQMRDMADNDNRNAQQQMQDARAMQAWAASRANDGPEWQAWCMAATQQAQATMRKFKPKAAQ